MAFEYQAAMKLSADIGHIGIGHLRDGLFMAGNAVLELGQELDIAIISGSELRFELLSENELGDSEMAKMQAVMRAVCKGDLDLAVGETFEIGPFELKSTPGNAPRM